jgi:two-component sensor histidine kinase
MHRVKNTLATVQAIATRTLRRAPVEERDAFTARLHALSKAHDLLTSDTWDRAPLRGVITAALAPFPQERFELSGPDLMLNASKSLHMTLALHELATNAAKYGALSTGAGEVRLSWWVEGGTCLKVCWRETGGPVVSSPAHKGFGSLLIEHTFDAVRFAYAPQGVCCEFELAVA